MHLRLLLPVLACLVACGDPHPTPTPLPDAQAGADAQMPPDSTADTTPGVDVAPDVPEAPFQWPVPTGPIAITPSPDWRNTLELPSDPFLVYPESSWESGAPQWVKFAVLMGDPSKVYYQDSHKYPFHQSFATTRLDPLVGMTPAHIDAVSLHAQGQQVIFGAVLVPTNPAVEEVGVQLVRQDPYHREMVKVVLGLVQKSLQTATPRKVFYFPTFEQAQQAQQDAKWLFDQGFPVDSPARWSKGTACYAQGWAVGKLRHVPGADIAKAFGDGTLQIGDVLLTDTVPAEVPPVAAILATQPSTPTSHVAILAENLGIPFAYLAEAQQVAALQAQVGQEVIVKTRPNYQGAERCMVEVLPAQGLDEPTRALLQGFKQPKKLTIQPKVKSGAVALAVETLTPQDAPKVGGKAANYSILRKILPQHSRPAVALTFDLWDAWLDQKLAGGKTLRDEIQSRLKDFNTTPGVPQPYPQVPKLLPVLAGIRQLIDEQTAFSPAQQAAVLQALAGFDAKKPLRFRSSTNVEDGAEFTGAGLYESKTGCIADDQDADTAGPGLCEPDEQDERGVFRAIRKVYASFWNDQAYLERLRRGVAEDQVGMALLVHHNFPDATEMANGVAVVRVNAEGSPTVLMATQKGAVSVANPEGGALPEVVEMWQSMGKWSPMLKNASSLVPLGGHVLAWPQDYLTLGDWFGQLAQAWPAATGQKPPFSLDIEFKKVAQEGLVLKQVRSVPTPAGSGQVEPVLLGDTLELCVFQGEWGAALGNHRGKSRWKLTARPGKLTAEAKAAQSLLQAAEVELVVDGQRKVLAGPKTWPGYQHVLEEGQPVDRFEVQTATGKQIWSLVTEIPASLPEAHAPLASLTDLQFRLRIDHAQPVPEVEYDGKIVTVSTDELRLRPCQAADQVSELHPLTQRTVSKGGVQVSLQWHQPPPPQGPTAGYTAPLFAWKAVTVTGLTPQPLQLSSWWALTTRPQHHNFTEHFVIEPRLDPSLPPAALQALEQAGVRALVVVAGDAEVLWKQGLDGQWTNVK